MDDDRARLLRGIRNALVPAILLWVVIAAVIWWII
jgi:hypothetical protein